VELRLRHLNRVTGVELLSAPVAFIDDITIRFGYHFHPSETHVAFKRRFKIRKDVRWITFVYLLLFVCGCVMVVGSGEKPSQHVIADTVLVIDQAIKALTNPSADYRKILEGTLATLPRDSQDFIRADIRNFLDRAPAVGVDFKCDASFVQYTALKELGRLKDTLLNTNPQPARPQFCYAVPIAVDATRPVDALEIYGYDFDQVPLEMFVMNSDGFFKDVSFALIKKTHYHLTLNLGVNGVTFSSDSQMLSVAWGHLVRYSIPLIHPTTPLCGSWLEETPDGKTITYAPLLIDGDGRFPAPGAKVWASATLDYESNKVDATLCVTAADPKGDSTIFSGCGVEYVYTSEPERVIEGVLAGLNSQVTYTHGNQGDDVMEGTRDGPVAQWTFAGLRRQSEDTETQVTIRLRKIRVVSTQPDGCVSAIAYLEAKRMNALSPTTTERLDSQLKKIDPEISSLRPRFAPSSH
jgi:hypothetical protein